MGAVMGHPVRNIFRQLLLGSLGAESSQPAWFSPRCHLQRNRKQLRLGSAWLGWAGLGSIRPGSRPSHLLPCCGYREGARQKASHVSVIAAHLLQHDSRQLPSLPPFVWLKAATSCWPQRVPPIFRPCQTLRRQHLRLVL